MIKNAAERMLAIGNTIPSSLKTLHTFLLEVKTNSSPLASQFYHRPANKNLVDAFISKLEAISHTENRVSSIELLMDELIALNQQTPFAPDSVIIEILNAFFTVFPQHVIILAQSATGENLLNKLSIKKDYHLKHCTDKLLQYIQTALESRYADKRYHALAFLQLFANDIEWRESEQKNLLLCLHKILSKIRNENYTQESVKFNRQCIFFIRDLYPILSPANRAMFAKLFLFDSTIFHLMFQNNRPRLKWYFLDYDPAEEAIQKLLEMLISPSNSLDPVCEILALFVEQHAVTLKEGIANFQLNMQAIDNKVAAKLVERRASLLHIYFYYLFDKQTMQNQCNKLCKILTEQSEPRYILSWEEFTDMLIFNHMKNSVSESYVENSMHFTDVIRETADAIFGYMKEVCPKIGGFPYFLPYLQMLPMSYRHQYIALAIEILSKVWKEGDVFYCNMFNALIDLWRSYNKDFPLHSFKAELQEQLKTCCSALPASVPQFVLLGMLDETLAKNWLAQVTLNACDRQCLLDKPVQSGLNQELQTLFIDKMFNEIEQLDPKLTLDQRHDQLHAFRISITPFSLNASQTRKLVTHLMQLNAMELHNHKNIYEYLHQHLHLLTKKERNTFANDFIDKLIKLNSIMPFKYTHLTKILCDASAGKLMALIQQVPVLHCNILAMRSELKLRCLIILSLAAFLDFEHRSQLRTWLQDDKGTWLQGDEINPAYSIYVKYGLCVLDRNELEHLQRQNLCARIVELPADVTSEINTYIPRRQLL